MYTALCIIIGIAIGILIEIVLEKLTSSFDGLLIVNDSDFEKTRWIIDVKTDPATIPDKKELHLKVTKMVEEDV